MKTDDSRRKIANLLFEKLHNEANKIICAAAVRVATDDDIADTMLHMRSALLALVDETLFAVAKIMTEIDGSTMEINPASEK